MGRYTHKSGEVVNTVPGSPLHSQMVAKAADDESGWKFDMPTADKPRDVRSGHGTAVVQLDATPKDNL